MERLAEHTQDFWDAARTRLDVIRSRRPLTPTDFYLALYPSSPPRAEPSKPEPPERTMAQRLWPNME